ncbi:MAG: hypothetical protein BWY66_00394 [bacterium ADurb.Bin374]|nr:MAG: hypothetical protein BWY66_00394 [bacterium ADurb.Bin374]
MDRSHTQQLLCRFCRIGEAEVRQEIRLAEHEARGRGERLAWTIAFRNLLDIEKVKLPDQMDEFGYILLQNMRAPDPEKEEREWRDILAELSEPARKLASFAKEQAERFEDVPDGIWSPHNLSELRRRIKREFSSWAESSGDPARLYYAARTELVTVLHRNSRKRKKAR